MGFQNGKMDPQNKNFCKALWHTPVIPALQRLRKRMVSLRQPELTSMAMSQNTKIKKQTSKQKKKKTSQKLGEYS
jgi:hypothetical protein